MRWVSLSRLSEIGIAFTGAFGGFFGNIAPPEDIAKYWAGLASVIAGASFLVVLLFSRTQRGQKHLRHLLRLVLLFLCVGLVLAIAYYVAYTNFTANYAGFRRVVGTEYTSHGAQYHDQHPEYDSEQLLFDFGGRADEVWTSRSLARGRLLLGFLYSATIGCVAFGLMLGVETLKGGRKG